MIRTGDREIHPLFGRLPDNPGELAYVVCNWKRLEFGQHGFVASEI